MDFTKRLKDKGIEAVAVLNVASYAGGAIGSIFIDQSDSGCNVIQYSLTPFYPFIKYLYIYCMFAMYDMCGM